MRSIQPGQPGVALGEYDVMIPVPYPINIDTDGSVLNQDFWRGDPFRLIGFQKDRDIQHIDVPMSEWMDNDPDSIVGMYPVFLTKGDDSGIWNDLRHVERVTEYADYQEGK
jgi:hypothetical protein